MAVAEVVEPVGGEALSTRPSTFWRQILQRLMSDPNALIGIGLLALMVALAVLAPLISRYPPNAYDINALN